MHKNKHIPMPSKEIILSIYDFDENTGLFFNRRLKRVSGTQRKSGHVFIVIERTHFAAHRLAYYLHHGSDPGHMFVDHINRNPSDNRPVNLRLATLAENTRNMKGARKDSSTGIRGVRWRKKDRYWYAAIGVNGKQIHIGCFKQKEDAIKAVTEAREHYFGEFSGGT